MKALKTIKKTEGQRRKEQKNIRIGYLFIFPVVIGLVVFTVIPFFYSLYLAFTDYNGLNAPDWVGLQNFATMFWEDDKFWLSFKITLKFAIVQVPLKLIFALLVALLLSRGSKGVGAYRVAFYVPSVLGGSVAVAVVWRNIFGLDGYVNSILTMLGLERVPWLSSTTWALPTLVLLNVWQFGSSMIIFLAGLKQIPKDLYESASIDGAGPIRRFFNITLPMLSPVIFFNLIYGMIGAFQQFNSAFLISEGGPAHSTYLYAMMLYEKAFSAYQMGYAAALAWILLAIVGAFTALNFLVSKYWVYYDS